MPLRAPMTSCLESRGSDLSHNQIHGYWLMYQPPLGDMTWPVMNLASSLAR